MARRQYPLSTLREERRGPRARLVSGWLLAFAVGESNPVDRGKRFQSYIFVLLLQACPGASWAHARRKFWEAAIAKDAFAREGLARIARIFALDRAWRG